MLSIPDMAILGAAALLFFGPEQLPRVMRKAGMFMRDVQNTSQSFVREMERAADEHDAPDVSRGHLMDAPAPTYDSWSDHAAGETAAYGAYDGGAVASHAAVDIPADEHPAPDTVAAEPGPAAHETPWIAHDVNGEPVARSAERQPPP